MWHANAPNSIKNPNFCFVGVAVIVAEMSSCSVLSAERLFFFAADESPRSHVNTCICMCGQMNDALKL